MSEIPRSLLDQLTKELNAFSSVGQQMIMNALSNAEWSDVAELRAIMVEVMEMVCGETTDMAAARTAEFYDSVRTAAVGGKFGALAESGRRAEATEGAVRALVQTVVDTGSTERFARELCDRIDYEVKKSAGDTIAVNAKRDPLKPRFARVPSGSETCMFCIMLASRGFDYKSEKSAGGANHYHPNCDCRIVPGFKGMRVEGYDPKALHETWKESRHRDYMDDRARQVKVKNYEAYREKLRLKSKAYAIDGQRGVLAGALNDSNDPTFGRREAHAKAYYKAQRARVKKIEVSTISTNTGLDEDVVTRAYEHLFIDKHDLRGAQKRFDPDYEIAQSWQRLRDGKNISPHDITLVKHEAYEQKLMQEGLSYEDAHKKSEVLYNYAKDLSTFSEGREGGL